MQQRLPTLLTEPLAFGHRGARAHAAENTLGGFELALRLGANALESDVWLTADGVPVLDHDGAVRRRFGRSTPIGAVQRADLPAHIPSLADLIERCGTAYHLSLDLKDRGSGDAVIDVVGRADPGFLERVWLCAPDWRDLVELRGKGARLVDSTRLVKIKEGPERRAATLAAEGIDGVNMHHTDWTGGLVTLFHRFQRVAFGWDMQQPEVLANCLRMGLDGVYSDWVDRMVEAFTAEHGAPVRPR